jgi:DNA-binding transcriptional LysR family regulator
MELRHLRVFVAVAEELHFGRAAQRLHLSQPPVSLAIKELESELGLRLLERSSRHIELTPDGEEVLRDARAALARIESLRLHAQSAARGARGALSIDFISLASYSFLPEVLRRFCADFPEVRLTLTESSSDRIQSDVEAGALDLGCLMPSPQMPPTLTYQPTNRYPLVVALPERHPLARLARVPLERLANERFLIFERHIGPVMFDTVVATCMRHGFSPRIFPARQQHTIVSLVAGEIGVALVPSCVQVLHREGVVYRQLRGEQMLVETGVVWRTEDDSPVVRAFVGYLPRMR